MKKEPMYVICFYWPGDRWQITGRTTKVDDSSYARHLKRVGTVDNELVSRYINNLYSGVKRFADRDFRFVCFTNEENLRLLPAVEIRPIIMPSSKGVLPRMFMFSRYAGLFGHQVLCLDLDVLITGSLTDIMNRTDSFCARTRFAPGEYGKIDGDVMSFRADHDNERRFWWPLQMDPKKVEEQTQGRERYWVEQVLGDDVHLFEEKPSQIVSYKLHVMKHKQMLPENARIISCHGYPRPHQIKDKWIKEYWK